MQENLSKYKLLNKRLTGQTLNLFFGNSNTDKPAMVLELEDIVAFIEPNEINADSQITLSVDQAGSYGTDMAIRLKRPEVSRYQEIFLFSDPEFINCSFRALAKTVKWRPFDNQENGDINY